jgi:CHAT domain-containing protein/tetratricopeptide (TPR) repeat protein
LLTGSAVLLVLVYAGAARAEPDTVQPPGACVLPREAVQEIDHLLGNIQELRASGRYAAARQRAQEVVDRRRQLQGPDHWETATARWILQSLDEIAALPAEAQAELAEAERLEHGAAQQCLRERRYTEGVALLDCIHALRRRYLPDDNRDVIMASYGLAVFLQRRGQNELATPRFQEILEGNRRRLGEDHPDTGRLSCDVADILRLQGDYTEAEEHARRGLTIYDRVLGPTYTPSVAYESLAGCLQARGRYAEAEVLQRQAVLRSRHDKGDEHPDTATACATLAEILKAQGNYAEAEGLCRTALRILRARRGERDPVTAKGCSTLAGVLEAQGKYAEAESLYRSAAAVYRAALGAEHSATLYALLLLANDLDGQGKYAEAEPIHEELLAVSTRVLGERNSITAQAHAKWGIHLQARGRYPEAESEARKALETTRAMLGEHSLQAVSCRVNLATALAGQDRQAEAEAAWRDAVAAYEGTWLRLKPRGLEQTLGFTQRSPRTSLVARLIRDGKATEAWQLWEAELAPGLLEEQAARHPAPAARAARVLSLEEVQAQLPDDTALVGWFWVRTTLGPPGPREYNWACVIRRRGAPVWVPLPGTGPDGTWTEEENRLRLQWSRAVVEARPEWQDLARRLYALCAAPLEKHLERTADLPPVRCVVCLGLDRLGGPVELLADRLVVSYTPSTTLFVEQAAAGKRPITSAGPLLALGDPVFERAGNLPALAASRGEVEAIAGLFDRADILLGSDASKQKLVGLVADRRLGDYRVLHLATHGVLSPSRPFGSALVLSQDGLPSPLEQVLHGREPFDDRLTAAEIVRTWKLDADLVTLSACHSALGKYQYGEGHLGFTQALLLAGARSCVLSLWKVDDQATALLMTRFYENLLGKRAGLKEPMARAEALTEAKAWLRKLPGEEVAHLAQTRGERQREPAPSTAPAPFAHPYYWAGFVLVGSSD